LAHNMSFITKCKPTGNSGTVDTSRRAVYAQFHFQ
jgi:hypothetical protein